MKTKILRTLATLLIVCLSCEQKEVQYQSQDLVFVGQYTSALRAPQSTKMASFILLTQHTVVLKVDSKEILVYLLSIFRGKYCWNTLWSRSKHVFGRLIDTMY